MKKKSGIHTLLKLNWKYVNKNEIVSLLFFQDGGHWFPAATLQRGSKEGSVYTNTKATNQNHLAMVSLKEVKMSRDVPLGISILS